MQGHVSPNLVPLPFKQQLSAIRFQVLSQCIKGKAFCLLSIDTCQSRFFLSLYRSLLPGIKKDFITLRHETASPNRPTLYFFA